MANVWFSGGWRGSRLRDPGLACAGSDVKVYNGSPDTTLECFLRVSLE